MKQVVIVGAGYGGLTCALRLARRARRHVEVTLVNATNRFVERIRLHQLAAAQRSPDHDLGRMLRGTGVRLHVGRATAIDLQRRTLRVGDDELRWDTLVLALGSRVDLDSVPGTREHAYALDGTRAEELAQTLAALRGKRPRARAGRHRAPALAVVALSRRRQRPSCAPRDSRRARP